MRKWKTTGIDNDASFEVERSYDGYSFEPIQKIHVVRQQLKTSFEHEDPLAAAGKVYYRIKLAELSKTSYSKIIAWKQNLSGFRLLQNVVASKLQLVTDSPAQFYITDVSGRVVRKVNVSDNSSEIDISSLRSGLYFLGNASGVTVKFVKQ
jgi:hypothetical protein